MEWSGMASPQQQQSQQDPIELQEHERVIRISSVPSRVAIFTALVFEVAVGCRRNSSPLRSGRSAPFEYVFLLGVNHGAACRRKPLDLQKNRTKHTGNRAHLFQCYSHGKSSLLTRFSIVLSGGGEKKKLAAVGFEPTPPKRLVP
ncbi:hypothetical protein HZH68_002470 [Vespula germanica]|uniref:Uncharacterized protein n=1 Tax=Vespula germanica TaxID=30212 RepID=A0A834U0J3_VESGE|nr:hypothetical protein HZH68_002470 [Vespula germanica]